MLAVLVKMAKLLLVVLTLALYVGVYAVGDNNKDQKNEGERKNEVGLDH